VNCTVPFGVESDKVRVGASYLLIVPRELTVVGAAAEDGAVLVESAWFGAPVPEGVWAQSPMPESTVADSISPLIPFVIAHLVARLPPGTTAAASNDVPPLPFERNQTTSALAMTYEMPLITGLEE
jgi:hypothetical protein